MEQQAGGRLHRKGCAGHAGCRSKFWPEVAPRSIANHTDTWSTAAGPAVVTVELVLWLKSLAESALGKVEIAENAPDRFKETPADLGGALGDGTSCSGHFGSASGDGTSRSGQVARATHDGARCIGSASCT